jgi:hypothetical protein
MAAKGKIAKRSKKLATGKKMAGVKPLAKYDMTEVLISSNSISTHGAVPDTTAGSK